MKESRQVVHSAAPRSQDFGCLRVTHPFHPLAGQVVPVLFQRRRKYGGRAYTCDGGAIGNATLPESFTDRCLSVVDGPLTIEVLSELLLLIERLRAGLDRVDGELKLV